MLPLVAIGLASAATGLASSIFGGSKAAKAAKQANRQLEQQKKENQAWYDRRYNQDYTQTAEAQSLLNYAREQADRNWKKAEGGAAVGGATDESVAQAKEAGNRMISDTASNVAAQSTSQKNAVENQYMQTKYGLTNQQIANLQNKAANISKAAGNASSAFMNLSGTLLGAKFGGANNTTGTSAFANYHPVNMSTPSVLKGL